MKLPTKMSSQLAEEIGWHLGDGSMNWYNGKGFYQLRGHFSDDRQHYETVIKPFFAKLFNIEINLREMLSTGVFGFQIWSDDLVRFKQKLGLPLGPKIECCIPKIIFNNKQHTISAIRGIFDTDGTIYLENKRGKLYPRIEIKQSSQTLAKQIHKALANLGFRVTLHIESRRISKWHPLHVISVRGNEMLNKWIKVVKPNNPKHTQKFEKFCNKQLSCPIPL